MEFHGYLRKKNDRGRWQQRWFTLQGTHLRYYESQHGANPKGVISVPSILSVHRIEAIDKEAFCFELRCKDRTYVLSGHSEQVGVSPVHPSRSLEQALTL